ncbi:hypothetical protein [Paenibacillus sp. NFR01]|uniref:hypothetical protein n=1 Tax=Paenibacillus sp. NFR01 TaxID=1566279 RepID=UPI0008D4BD67|nr:hypothetical protein [Paenibacillus sp. NFR01]SET98454.1 hypothetical protein SAMN03159358_2971 [Paenibacillus sp. NFR01]
MPGANRELREGATQTPAQALNSPGSGAAESEAAYAVTAGPRYRTSSPCYRFGQTGGRAADKLGAAEGMPVGSLKRQ